MLEVEGLIVDYGHIRALHGLTLEVRQGEIVAIIGSNGAGKTSTLLAISGLVPVTEGSIRLDGMELTSLPPHVIVTRGVTQVPEGRQVFGDQTVEDNLLLGAWVARSSRMEVRERMEREFQRFPILKQRRRQLAGTLSGGEQQMLAIARGLMSNPRLLLLDEPSMGLAPRLVQTILDTIVRLRDEGVTILLVEQMAAVALRIADRAYVLEGGRVNLSGLGGELLKDPRVKAAYLGGKDLSPFA